MCVAWDSLFSVANYSNLPKFLRNHSQDAFCFARALLPQCLLYSAVKLCHATAQKDLLAQRKSLMQALKPPSADSSSNSGCGLMAVHKKRSNFCLRFVGIPFLEWSVSKGNQHETKHYFLDTMCLFKRMWTLHFRTSVNSMVLLHCMNAWCGNLSQTKWMAHELWCQKGSHELLSFEEPQNGFQFVLRCPIS